MTDKLPNQRARMRAHRTIVWVELAGFGTIIAASWADEQLDLADRLFGMGTHVPNLSEAAFESSIAVACGITVLLLTSRLLKRLTYLEQFLRVCAWCQKINHGNDWVSSAKFFQQRFDIDTSHGICPECSAALEHSAAEPE